jgi:SAM-dependent methyltransferase
MNETAYTPKAEQNPTSHVIGTDLSAIQPDVGGLPNCEFVKDDMEEDWISYPAFDYIHMRFMFTCFNDARRVLKQAYRNLNPGGWIEYQDMVTEIHQENPDFKGTAHQRWLSAIIEGAAVLGRDIQVTRKYRAWLTEEGCKPITNLPTPFVIFVRRSIRKYEPAWCADRRPCLSRDLGNGATRLIRLTWFLVMDVVERKIKVPIGPWSDEPNLQKLGKYMSRNMTDAARGTPWKMLRSGGLSVAEVDALVLELKRELQDQRNHSFIWV